MYVSNAPSVGSIQQLIQVSLRFMSRFMSAKSFEMHKRGCSSVRPRITPSWKQSRSSSFSSRSMC